MERWELSFKLMFKELRIPSLYFSGLTSRFGLNPSPKYPCPMVFPTVGEPRCMCVINCWLFLKRRSLGNFSMLPKICRSLKFYGIRSISIGGSYALFMYPPSSMLPHMFPLLTIYRLKSSTILLPILFVLWLFPSGRNLFFRFSLKVYASSAADPGFALASFLFESSIFNYVSRFRSDSDESPPSLWEKEPSESFLRD